MTNIPLVIAAHGTREEAGVAACHKLVGRIRSKLRGTRVEVGFVELTPPTISEALVQVLQGQDKPKAVVIPLMVGDGGHVRDDIPEAIEEAKAQISGSDVAYGGYLGQDPRLVQAIIERTHEARKDWEGSDVAVIVLGRGTLVPEANGDHCRLTRLIEENTGLRCEPAFIQVVDPDLTTALQRVYDSGARRIVVVPNYLFPGRLSAWMHEQSSAWAIGKDVELRCAEVIGDSDALADVVIDRYRAAALTLAESDGSPAYLSGLVLAGRKVLVVGGGAVNTRRVPGLLNAGAKVILVSPEATPELRALAEAGRLVWEQRVWQPDDLTAEDAPWYVLAATDSPEVNREVAERAEAAHTFCVRADLAASGSAWTPSVQTVGGHTLALLGTGNPKLAQRARKSMAKVLAHVIVSES